jgi:type IV pilus assembly protein PilY1
MIMLAKNSKQSGLQSLCFGLVLAMISMVASAAPLDLSNSPLFLLVTMPPNIVTTLDTSGSMTAAHTPDALDSRVNTKRYKSATYNPMYYNPNVQYLTPFKFDGTKATTSFAAAHMNGFDPSKGTTTSSSSACNPKGVTGKKYSPVDLVDNYAATSDYGLANDSQSCTTADSGSLTTTFPPTTYSSTCQVDFDNNSSTDRIYIDSGCAGIFTNLTSGRSLTVSGATGAASVRNGTYSVTSVDSSSARINLGGAWSGSTDYNNVANVTLAFTYTPAPVTTSTNPAYYYLYYTDKGVAKPGSCPSTPSREDDACYVKVIVGATDDGYKKPDGTAATAEEKKQNFANWYSFYRVRTLAMVSSADLAFWGMSSDLRLAWQNLSTCNTFTGSDCQGRSNTNYPNYIKEFSGAHRDDFFKWLFDIKTAGGTPLRIAAQRVGEYYKTGSVVNSPYAEFPQSSVGTEYSCRKNFHILMTDGEWNTTGESGLNTYGNLDNTAATLPDGKSFPVSKLPYTDSNSDSLSDVIFRYWATDLRTDLDDDVPPFTPDVNSADPTAQYFNPKNDPATWQHVVTYTVGLGLTNQLTDPVWGGSTYAGDYPKLLDGTKSWPSTGTTQGKVYDLWHGALNSRGKFFSVDNPEGLKNAFSNILTSISGQNSAAAAAAANSTSIQSGTVLYQAQFDPKNWSGHLFNFTITSNGTVQNLDGEEGLGAGDANWDAGAFLPGYTATSVPAHTTRNIKTFNGTAGVDFLWANLTTIQQTALKTSSAGVVGDNAIGQDRLDWLRGVTTKEARNVGGIFRNRLETVLGDIVNSDPTFSGSDNYGYASLPVSATEQSTYAAFVTGKSSRAPMIYAGANDGMLHAFRADTGNASSGRELFAYVPAAVYGNLSSLTETDYSHKYFVDGTPTISDAYLSGAWKTVLVGGLGKGGKAIYAMDISTPTAFANANVLWEYSGSTAVSADGSGVTDANGMGLTYSQPQIARLNNGTWAVIFGNGYNSQSERAFLYIVDLSTGALIKKIATDTTTSNGLSTARLYDQNNDKIIDYVYAGDLQGNLWKFDLSANNSDSWTLGNGGTPLFTARNSSDEAQPITAAPRIGGHASGGVLVYFGTGSYLSNNDPSDLTVQSMYAIWDRFLTPETLLRSNLVQQSITNVVSKGTTKTIPSCTDSPTIPGNECEVTFNFDIREVSANTVDYSTERGWFLDFIPVSGTAEGERIIVSPLLKDERVIFLTVIPSNDPCTPGGVSWLMELDATSGGATTVSSFDFNNDGAFNAEDTLPSDATGAGVQLDGMGKDVVWLENENGSAIKEISLHNSNIQSIPNCCPTPPPSGGGDVHRLDWRQIQ